MVAPGGIQDCIARQWTIDVLNKEQKKVILGGCYFNHLTAPRYSPPANIDRPIGETNYVLTEVNWPAIESRVGVGLILVRAGRSQWVVHYDDFIHLRHAPPLRYSLAVVQRRVADSFAFWPPSTKRLTTLVTFQPAKLFPSSSDVFSSALQRNRHKTPTEEP